MAEPSADSHNKAGTPFTFEDKLASWNIPLEKWLADNNKDQEWSGIATSALVMNSHGQILLVQRASHDSMPNKWEVPGGAVDEDDSSILHAAARELHEEAGLTATHFSHVVPIGPGLDPARVFLTSKGKTFGCFAFFVEVESCDTVTLDPNEHQHHLWASEAEVREQMVGAREIPITTKDVASTILEAFRLNKSGAEPV